MEDGTAAAGCRRAELAELVQRLHRCLGYGVVAEDDAHLVLIDIVLLQVCSSQRVARRHIGILCLLGHELSEITVHVGLQVGLRHIGAEGRAKARVDTLLTEHDTTLSVIQ